MARRAPRSDRARVGRKAIARRTEESDRRGRSGSTSGDHEDRGRSASKQVTLTSDGSCLFNPGPGSWPCLLRFGAAEPVLSGSEPGHNKERGVNRYVSRCVSAGWLNSRGERIANRGLWEELIRKVGDITSNGPGFVVMQRI